MCFKTDGAQIQQAGNDVSGEPTQVVPDQSVVRVEIEAAMIVTPGDVNLPNPLERNSVEHALDALMAVALVRQEIVQFEQDAAIGMLRDGGKELTVIDLVVARRK